MTVERARVAVFASGVGTNFQALLDAQSVLDWPAEIVCLATDRPECGAVARAEAADVPVVAKRLRGFSDKVAYETAILVELQKLHVHWIALCGYMRLIGQTLLSAYGGRIVNIHPSLLPAFPGRHAVADALHAGVPQTGVTIHFVDEGVDTGPIIAQETVPIDPGTTESELLAKVHAVEHVLYPAVLRKLIEDTGRERPRSRSGSR